MRYLWLSARKDLARRFADPVALLLWTGIPLLILLLLHLAFGSGTSPKTPQVHLLIADQDASLGSQFLLGAFGQQGMGELFDTETVSEEVGRERIAAGDGSALLVIPAGFGDALLGGEPVTLELVKNPSQTILPGIAEEVVTVLAEGSFYLREALGEPLDAIGDAADGGGPSDELVSSVSVTINQLMNRVGEYLFPPVIDVEFHKEESESPPLQLGQAFFPSMLFMSLLFIAQSLSDDLWSEKEQGTLRRVASLPRPLLGFLAGKLVAGALLFALIISAATLLGVLLFDVEAARAPFAVAWGVLSGLMLTSLLQLIQVHATSQRAGSILTSFVAFPLLLAGGSFFPFELMPDWLAAAGSLLPNGWAMQQFKAILAGTVDAQALLLALAGILAFLGMTLVISARRVRRRFIGA